LAYPDDFDTSAFVAGRRIALSRVAAIWTMVSFFLIIATCIALPWVQKNMRVAPVVINVDGVRGEWRLVGRDAPEENVPYYQSMQRALVGIFTEKWFTVSTDADVNEMHWKSCSRTDVCSRTVANTFWNDAGCDIYCISGESMYQNFVTNVVPLYRARAEFGERWYVDVPRMEITPNGAITQNGGSWVVNARVRSNLNGDFNIIAYVKVVHDDTSRYPQTLGYYVTGFNSYRMQ